VASTLPASAAGAIVKKTFEVQCRAEAGCLRAQVTGWVDTYEATLAFFREIAAELHRSAPARC